VTAERLKRRLAAAASKGGIKSVVETYLSITHRNHPEQGCPLAALGSELANADEGTRHAATCGLNGLIDIIAGLTGEKKRKSLGNGRSRSSDYRRGDDPGPCR